MTRNRAAGSGGASMQYPRTVMATGSGGPAESVPASGNAVRPAPADDGSVDRNHHAKVVLPHGGSE